MRGFAIGAVLMLTACGGSPDRVVFVTDTELGIGADA